MKKPPVVVADADAIVAQAFPKDNNHKKASDISKRLVKLNAQVIYPVTAIVEAVTVIQRVLNSSATAYATAVTFTNPGAEIAPITNRIYSNAVNKYFSPDTSKKNTLFDCIVASVADEYGAEAVFSFDKFYKAKGFKLASDLVFYKIRNPGK